MAVLSSSTVHVAYSTRPSVSNTRSRVHCRMHRSPQIKSSRCLQLLLRGVSEVRRVVQYNFLSWSPSTYSFAAFKYNIVWPQDRVSVREHGWVHITKTIPNSNQSFAHSDNIEVAFNLLSCEPPTIPVTIECTKFVGYTCLGRIGHDADAVEVPEAAPKALVIT